MAPCGHTATYMQTIVFDFKQKIVAVAGTAQAERIRAEIAAAQRKAVSKSLAVMPTARPR